MPKTPSGIAHLRSRETIPWDLGKIVLASAVYKSACRIRSCLDGNFSIVSFRTMLHSQVKVENLRFFNNNIHFFLQRKNNIFFLSNKKFTFNKLNHRYSFFCFSSLKKFTSSSLQMVSPHLATGAKPFFFPPLAHNVCP